MELTILTPQQTTEPVNETALLNSLFGEVPPAAAEMAAEPAADAIAEAPVNTAPIETAPAPQLEPLPEAQRSYSDETLAALIDSMNRNTQMTNEQGEYLRNLMNPQKQEEIPEEELAIRELLKKEVDPIKQENAMLKARLEALAQAEEQRATEKMVSDFKAKYPDFDPNAIGQQMTNIAVRLEKQFLSQGATPQQARQAAEYQTRIMWDNPQGIENLYLLLKARNAPPAPAPQAAPQRTPDQHIAGQNTPTPPKSWKDKMKSDNEAERNSVFNEMF